MFLRCPAASERVGSAVLGDFEKLLWGVFLGGMGVGGCCVFLWVFFCFVLFFMFGLGFLEEGTCVLGA